MRRVTEIAVVRRSADTNRDGGERQVSVSATPNVSAYEPSAANMERDRLGQWTYSDGNKETMSTNLIRGLDHMRDPRLNKVSLECNNRLAQLTNITSLFSQAGHHEFFYSLIVEIKLNYGYLNIVNQLKIVLEGFN